MQSLHFQSRKTWEERKHRVRSSTTTTVQRTTTSNAFSLTKKKQYVTTTAATVVERSFSLFATQQCTGFQGVSTRAQIHSRAIVKCEVNQPTHTLPVSSHSTRLSKSYLIKYLSARLGTSLCWMLTFIT